jgi:hypothetical protein
MLYENVFQNPELFPSQVSLSTEKSALVKFHESPHINCFSFNFLTLALNTKKGQFEPARVRKLNEKQFSCNNKPKKAVTKFKTYNLTALISRWAF